MMVACENYARVSHVIMHVIALIRVTLSFASQSNATCRLELWVSTRRFSAVEYKSFHDIMVEEFNSFSENASCSVPLETNHGTVH
jgi:hypothetical protein